MTEKIATSQKWTQAETFRFDTYEAAKAHFDTLTAERKRIRRRKATAHFDVVVYAPLKAKAPDPVEESAPVVEKKSKRAKNDKKGKRRGTSSEESLG